MLAGRAAFLDRGRESPRILLYGLAVVCCLTHTLAALAEDAQEIAISDVPRPAIDAVTVFWHGAKPVRASIVRDDGKEAFIITINHDGSTFDVSVRPNGHYVGRRERELSIEDWPDCLLVLAMSLLPGGTGAFLAIRLLQPIRPALVRPVLLEWLFAYTGAAAVLSVTFIIYSAATGTHSYDLLTVIVQLFAMSGISASVVEAGTLGIRAIRGRKQTDLVWSIAVGILCVVFVAASIWGEIHRRNQYNRAVTCHALDYPK